MNIVTKRIYEKPSKSDGYRVLVDRLWPRGISKKDAQLDGWAKSIAPSSGLRKWYDHDPGKWDNFKSGYEQELSGNPDWDKFIAECASHDKITLLYSSKEEMYNNARALKELLIKNQK